MSGEQADEALAEEVAQHLASLRAFRNALLVPHVEHERRHERAAESLDRAIDAAERLRARLAAERDVPERHW